MKGKIAVLLVLLICLTSFSSFALEESIGASDESDVIVAEPEEISKVKVSDKEVEDIVKMVKSQITIPDSYTKFTTGMSNYDGKKVWNLSWSGENDTYMSKGDGNIHVSVDSKGTIINFNHYKYNREYDYHKKIPEISRQQAYDYAKEFINKIGSDVVGELNFINDLKNVSVSFDGDYYVNIYRIVNDIPFYENNVSVTIEGRTGEVTNYYRNWLDDVEFPNSENIIDLSSAQEAYKEKVGLVLKYRKEYMDDNNKTYLEYSPDSINQNAVIDALTGEKVSLNTYYDIYGYGAAGGEMLRSEKAMKDQALNDENMVQLTEEELKETEAIKGLITVEEAEKIVRSIKAFGIDEGFKVNHYNLNRYDREDKYNLHLNFVKPMEDIGEDIPAEKLRVMIAAGEYNDYANVTMDAKTGEILSFNSYGRSSREEESKYEIEELKKTAEEFLTEYKADKYRQTEILEITDEMVEYIGLPYPETDGFNYIRIVNGIPFEDNRLSVFFNKSTGKIQSYSESWDEIEFVSADNVIGNERAYEVMFDDIGLELRYMTVPKKDVKLEYYTGNREDIDVKLVYAPTYNKPVSIDANSGAVINRYSSEPYVEKTEISFNDIEGHFAEESILALAEIEVLEYEESFRPDDVIKQKELLSIVSKIRGDYYIPIRSGESATKAEVDRMYQALETSDIIEPEEKNPEEEIIREDAVKYLLRAASYRKFAELDQSLFNCDFKDKDDINPELIGYVAISKVLNIMNGNDGYFNPKGSLTRGETAVMIYNYLKR